MRISDWSSDVCSSDLDTAEHWREGRLVNARLKSALWLALAIARGTVWIAVALLAGALVFVLFTQPGAQLGMRIASTVTDGMVTATGVQGSFWGPLKLQQLKISLAAADIELDDAEPDADYIGR